LAAAKTALVQANAFRGESDHGATKSIYGADPDGNEFEVMVLLPRDQWGAYEHQAPIMPLRWS
jgi:catechol-2,3-dioxygenase